jgi:hypothetical protein
VCSHRYLCRTSRDTAGPDPDKVSCAVELGTQCGLMVARRQEAQMTRQGAVRPKLQQAQAEFRLAPQLDRVHAQTSNLFDVVAGWSRSTSRALICVKRNGAGMLFVEHDGTRGGLPDLDQDPHVVQVLELWVR